MMPANKYSVISADATSLLTDGVNRALREGWQPHGSMQALQLGLLADGNPHYVFIQPMVLPHEPYMPRFETCGGVEVKEVARIIVDKLYDLSETGRPQTVDGLIRVIEQILSTGGKA